MHLCKQETIEECEHIGFISRTSQIASSAANFIFVSSNDSNMKSVHSIDAASSFHSIYGIKVNFCGIHYVKGESANILNVIISQE